MDLKDYVRILRQRWLLVGLPIVAATVVAVLTLPDQSSAEVPTATTYQATATLIVSPTAATEAASVSLPTVALFATTGEIPERAAELLDYEGEPQLLASQVTVAPSLETATLTITTTDADGELAARRVNQFARATIEFFRTQGAEQDQRRAQELNQQLAQMGRELENMRAKMQKDPGPVTEAKLESLQTQYMDLYTELGTVTEGGNGSDLLTVLQPGVPIPMGTVDFVAPSNPLTRIVVAGLLGLLLGAALALVVERLDSRTRTREQAEDAVGIPVLAEIPSVPRKNRGEIVSAARPASDVAEAFRALRSSVLLMNRDEPAGEARGPRPSLVVLVTSALHGEGKTTTVANLAAVMAEAGRSVLVLSLDLRNPQLHHAFHVPNGPGASDLLANGAGEGLAAKVQQTDVLGVSILTSGQHLDHPGALLTAVGPMVAAARTLADVVVIDTPPMLAVSDALDVARHADITLLVTRLNKTTRAQAAECQRLFKRLGISALGTVLVGSRAAGARYGYPLLQGMHEASPEGTEVAGASGERDGGAAATDR